MSDETNQTVGDPDNWEPAELKVRRPSTSVISVRMPAEQLIEVEEYAVKRSLSISDVVRLSIDALIHGPKEEPTYALLGSVVDAPLKLVGPTVQIQAVTRGSGSKQFENDATQANAQESLPFTNT